MKRQITMFAAAALMIVGVSSVQASEDWGFFCFRMVPFVDVLTMRLERPNPPKWNLDAQAEWNGDTAYALPGGGDLHTDLDATIEGPGIYAIHLTLYNTSTFFGGQPIISVRGVIGGPWTLEGRGRAGSAPFVTQGTITIIPGCSIAASAQDLSVSEQGSGLAGDARQ